MKKKRNVGNVRVKMSLKTSTKNLEKLKQLSKEELVEMILAQMETIEGLFQEIEKLKCGKLQTIYYL